MLPQRVRMYVEAPPPCAQQPRGGAPAAAAEGDVAAAGTAVVPAAAAGAGENPTAAAPWVPGAGAWQAVEWRRRLLELLPPTLGPHVLSFASLFQDDWSGTAAASSSAVQQGTCDPRTPLSTHAATADAAQHTITAAVLCDHLRRMITVLTAAPAAAAAEAAPGCIEGVAPAPQQAAPAPPGEGGADATAGAAPAVSGTGNGTDGGAEEAAVAAIMVQKLQRGKHGVSPPVLLAMLRTLVRLEMRRLEVGQESVSSIPYFPRADTVTVLLAAQDVLLAMRVGGEGGGRADAELEDLAVECSDTVRLSMETLPQAYLDPAEAWDPAECALPPLPVMDLAFEAAAAAVYAQAAAP